MLTFYSIYFLSIQKTKVYIIIVSHHIVSDYRLKVYSNSISQFTSELHFKTLISLVQLHWATQAEPKKRILT